MAKIILIGIIRTYKIFISPYLTKSCRFYPACSDYAIDSIKNLGVIKGTFFAILRILRCNPLSKGGYDPVKIPKNVSAISQR